MTVVNEGEFAMSDIKIVLACRDYDRTRRVIDGTVKAKGLAIQIAEMKHVANTFTNMFSGEYDVSEFSLGELVYHISRDKAGFIGIPIFPLRMFRHGWIFVNEANEIGYPGNLNGKRIGLYRLAQTACIWMRGMLAEEYNVSPKNTKWYVPSIHHWADEVEKDAITPHDGSFIRWLARGGPETNINILNTALIKGEIDALCSAVRPPSFVNNNGVKLLIENYYEAEIAYFRKTKIFPIMHTLAVRRALLEKHPELAVKLFEMFSESKNLASEWIKVDGSVALVWKDHYAEKELQTFERDPWVYGLQPNEHVIRKFLDYCYDQGVSTRAVEPKELFAPTTWHLTE